MQPWWIKRKQKPIEPFSQRDKFHAFYVSKGWQSLRLYKLSINPLCEECERKGFINPAEHVDHIIPLAEDFNLRLDLDNLQSLDSSCHSKKTKQEQALKKQRDIDSNMELLNEFHS